MSAPAPQKRQLDVWLKALLPRLDVDHFAADKETKAIADFARLTCICCAQLATSPCWSSSCCCTTVCYDCLLQLAKLKHGDKKTPSEFISILEQLACPTCRQKGTFDADYTKSKMIRELKVKCPCLDCEWTGQRTDLRDHVLKCPEAIVECPTGNTWPTEKCEHKCKRSAMQAHLDVCPLRLWVCPLCGDRNPYKNKDGHEKVLCPKRPTQCPRCKAETPCDQQSVHLNERCPFILCPGCHTPLSRSDTKELFQHVTKDYVCFQKCILGLKSAADNLRDENTALRLQLRENAKEEPPAKRRKVDGKSEAAPSAATAAPQSDRKEPDRSATKTCLVCSQTLHQMRSLISGRWLWAGHGSCTCPAPHWVDPDLVAASNGSSSRSSPAAAVAPLSESDRKEPDRTLTKECPRCHNALDQKQFRESGPWYWMHAHPEWLPAMTGVCTFHEVCRDD